MDTKDKIIQKLAIKIANLEIQLAQLTVDLETMYDQSNKPND